MADVSGAQYEVNIALNAEQFKADLGKLEKEVKKFKTQIRQVSDPTVRNEAQKLQVSKQRWRIEQKIRRLERAGLNVDRFRQAQTKKRYSLSQLADAQRIAYKKQDWQYAKLIAGELDHEVTKAVHKLNLQKQTNREKERALALTLRTARAGALPIGGSALAVGSPQWLKATKQGWPSSPVQGGPSMVGSPKWLKASKQGWPSSPIQGTPGMFGSPAFKGRIGMGISGGLTSAMFPLLFGGGITESLGGGLGGFAGSMIAGPMGGLAGGLVGQQLAGRIKGISEEVEKLNERLKHTGATSLHTRKSVASLADQLGRTKEETVGLLQSLSQFDSGEQREAIAAMFGGSYEQVSAATDISSTLELINSLRKEIGNEAAAEALEVLRTKGYLEAIVDVNDTLKDQNRERALSVAKEAKWWEYLLVASAALGNQNVDINDLIDERVKKLEEQFKVQDEIAESAAKADKALTDALNQEKKLSQFKQQLEDLMDPINQIISAADAIGNAFKTSFSGLISGSMTAGEAMASFFRNIAASFADMAAEMAATALKHAITQALFSAFIPGYSPVVAQPGGLPSTGGTTGVHGNWMPSPGTKGWATGGYVDSPQVGMVGEGGQGEYVIPESKMNDAMARYAQGSRGSAVIDGAAQSVEEGGGGTAVATAPIDVRFTSERINSIDYVTFEQFQAGVAAAAQQGARNGEVAALRRLQMNPSVRRRVGL